RLRRAVHPADIEAGERRTGDRHEGDPAIAVVVAVREGETARKSERDHAEQDRGKPETSAVSHVDPLLVIRTAFSCGGDGRWHLTPAPLAAVIWLSIRVTVGGQTADQAPAKEGQRAD